MFLSKKNAEYLNRPKKGKNLEQRVLPGWGDDEDNEGREMEIPHFNLKKDHRRLLADIYDKLSRSY